MIKQSLCTGCFYQADQDLDAFLKEVAAIGFDAVEPWNRDHTPYFHDLLEGCAKHNLHIPSMCGHGSIESGLNDSEQHERIVAELEASIDVAAQHNIDGLIVFAGERLKGQSDYEGLIACAAVLKKILPYAAEKNVPLRLELLNSHRDHFNYLGDHSAWGAALCEMLNSPYMQLLYDIYHMQIMEGNLCVNIRRHAKHIGHVHTAGVPGRGPLNDLQEINYPAVMKTLAAVNYQGYVAHEFFCGDDDDIMECLAEAYQQCTLTAATLS